MTVLIDVDSYEHHLLSRAPRGSAYDKTSPKHRVECLDIGLINNMSDAALMSTERQLFDLLNAAAGRLLVRLHFYTMEATPRTEWGRDYVRRYYRGIDDLLNRRLDGVIVTGAEPRAASLTEEPYWSTFVQIADWARENTVSSVFSCLAVHGAVLHLDGVARHKLPAKCFGVFAQRKMRHHSLMQDVPTTFRIPHARWNEVQEEDLANCGYSILSWSAEAGVDCFVKQQKKSLFVHFQGHPEYESLSLLGEHRRDMGRFLRGENEVCPTIPRGYLNEEAEEILIAFRQKALSDRRPELFADFPADQVTKDLNNVWHLPAKRIYRNWLLYMVSQRAGRSKPLGAGEAALSASGMPARRHGRKLVAARSARLAHLPDPMTKNKKRLGSCE
ncbi:homoserine O-succinyltransferase [Bradyrhizobium sp. CCGUVB1N3]|uniref:homoserine O-succinyltransferase MetA n=1 Tax=Bradyrhizobium sp. CCGUVB1N3 TaxID=2949629 RepID=UPI0020B442D4|nr:homoserine O-succinyltransferase [Bradyrhizobium sp. CCGUVB1N3]MCP3471597.1 homoserine O-succinyltransferase [Bradyrhizobium sp. CCGUVB1N3]